MRKYFLKTMLLCILAAVLTATVCAAGTDLPTIADCNTTGADGDHAGDDYMQASLEPDFHGNTKIVRAYLNHRIDAPTQTVTVDGNAAEWAENTDALFVGSETQAQVTLRVAHDAENVYFLLSRLDADLTDGDTVTVCVAADKTCYYRITADGRGAVSGVYVENAVEKRTFTGRAAVTVLGTENHAGDTDTGVLLEVAVPRAQLGLVGAKQMQVRLELKNKDAKDKVAITDSFTGVSFFATTFWPVVRLH